MTTWEYRFQPRRATAAEAAANNGVLLMGEKGFEKDTKRWKTGDGVRHWNDLRYDDELFGPVFHSLVSIDSDAIAPDTAFTSLSGHQLKWVSADGETYINTGTTGGRGFFWGTPGGNAAYLVTGDIGGNVGYAKMTFSFFNTGSTNGATACLAVTSLPMLNGLTNGASMSMAAHFRSTPSGWSYGVWVPGTGEVSLLSGVYDTPLVVDSGVTEYSLELRLLGDTAVFRTPDGKLHTVTDSRIGEYAGPYAFGESFMAYATDNVALVSGLTVAPTGGLMPPPLTEVVNVSPGNINGATNTGIAVLTGNASAARAAIGAGTSNLAIGTTGSTAKAGNYQPAAADISDSGAVGRTLVQATSGVNARLAIDAGLAQRARYGSRVVMDGDSITIGATTSSTWNQSRGGWCMEMARLSGGRLDIVYNAAVAGTGISTRLANFASKVAAYSPDTVILSNGTNDLASMALSDYLTSLTTYYNNCRAIGAQLILGGIYPKDVNQSTITTWNAALVEWAKPLGVLVIPFWELADPATGAWPSGWTSDGTHPLRESPAFAALGDLAWRTVSRALTEPVAPTARYTGEGIYTNFFTDLTATISGVATITAISSTTGTLPAGDYTYRVVPRNYWGKNTSYADSSITLGGTGGVTLTSGASGTYTRRAVYRKGPSDTTFYYIGQITATGSQTFTDNGTAAGYAWVDGDSSRVPNGLTNGATQDLHTLAYGPAIRPGGAGDSIRGNILRLTRQEGSANARIDRFLITGLTAGNTIVVTFKCRGPASVTATERVQLYFRDSSDATTIDTVPLVYHRVSSDWGLVFARLVVPPGSDRVRFSLEGDATSPWLDIAELRVA